MKKSYFILILLFLFIGIANAEECVVTKGTGENIGDEIKCGTEEFYVIDYTETSTTLLAKYNLYVGDIINYIPIDEGFEINDPEDYCGRKAEEAGFHPYFVYPMINLSEGNVTGCRVYENIETEHIRQDSRAEGTYLENGKSKLPLYGIVYMVPEWGYEAIENGVIKQNVYDSNGDLIVEGSSFEGYLNGYKEELESQGFTINEVSFPRLSRILSVIEKINGEAMEIDLEFPYDGYYGNNPENYIAKMNISDYIPEKYNWLYSVTYWVGSGFRYEDVDDHSIIISQYNDYYISNEAILCALGRGECGYFVYPIGNGIRPAVVINNENIKTASLEPETTEDEEDKPNPKTDDIAIITVAIIAIIAAGIIFYQHLSFKRLAK